MAADSDWQALTPKEETDLDTMMEQCENAISNAEDFAEQLSRDLSVLDGVCDMNNPSVSRLYIPVYIKNRYILLHMNEWWFIHTST